MGRRMPITSFKITDLKFQIWPYSTIPICLAIAQFERERERENTQRERESWQIAAVTFTTLSLSLSLNGTKPPLQRTQLDFYSQDDDFLMAPKTTSSLANRQRSL